MSPVDKEDRDYPTEFSLTPKERATYGATVTALSLDTGQTRTFVRTNETTMRALQLIIDELDLLAGDWRVVCISTPITIQRDLHANRIQLGGPNMGQTMPPERVYLAKLKRTDLLHPGKFVLATYAGPSAA